VLKQIVVAELQPDETVDAVREARLLAKVIISTLGLKQCGHSFTDRFCHIILWNGTITHTYVGRAAFQQN